jgi:hypothetical protein
MAKSLLSLQVSKYISGRTPRELAIGLTAAVLLGLMALYSFAIEPTAAAFDRQAAAFKDLENTRSVAPSILARYAKLAARRKELEQFYEKVDIRANPLSHLERLLRDVANVAPGAYNVSPREGVQLGGKYAHKIFLVKFETTSLESLTKFLKALTSGEQPMLISQINLEKRQTSETLSVQLEVSGFEAVAK